jgi:hypothetical protein
MSLLERAELQKMSEDVWIVRFVPNLINTKHAANALKVFNRGKLGANHEVKDEELLKITTRVAEVHGDSVIVTRVRSGDVLLFGRFSDAPEELIHGAFVMIKELLPSIKIKYGVSSIDRDRVFITTRPWWHSAEEKPLGFYAYEDIFK